MKNSTPLEKNKQNFILTFKKKNIFHKTKKRTWPIKNSCHRNKQKFLADDKNIFSDIRSHDIL